MNTPLMLLFGVVGYFMKRYDYSVLSFLMGFILLPIAEVEFFKAWQFSGGDMTYFVTPVSVVLVLVTLGSILHAVRTVSLPAKTVALIRSLRAHFA